MWSLKYWWPNIFSNSNTNTNANANPIYVNLCRTRFFGNRIDFLARYHWHSRSRLIEIHHLQCLSVCRFSAIYILDTLLHLRRPSSKTAINMDNIHCGECHRISVSKIIHLLNAFYSAHCSTNSIFTK